LGHGSSPIVRARFVLYYVIFEVTRALNDESDLR
jgi:hypothetical protein